MKSILIVDDEVDIISTFAMLFELRGFKVSRASHGKQALEMLQELTPDIILSDCMMPLMDGWELCDRVKNNPATSHVPFILMSAAPGNYHSRLSKHDLLLEKPFLFNDLMAQISPFLSR